MAHVPIPPAAERRIRREARSATLRERALALRQAGWTFTSIGIALGVSTTRALQIVRKAERLVAQRAAERDASPDNEAGNSNDGPSQRAAAKLSNDHVYTCHRQLEASNRPIKTAGLVIHWLRSVSGDARIGILHRLTLIGIGLHRYCNDSGYDAVASEIGVDRASVLRAVDIGIRRGWLAIRRDVRGNTNGYVLFWGGPRRPHPNAACEARP